MARPGILGHYLRLRFAFPLASFPVRPAGGKIQVGRMGFRLEYYKQTRLGRRLYGPHRRQYDELGARQYRDVSTNARGSDTIRVNSLPRVLAYFLYSHHLLPAILNQVRHGGFFDRAGWCRAAWSGGMAAMAQRLNRKRAW